MHTIDLNNGSDHLVLQIHGRTQPNAQTYWDANWLHCTADVSVGEYRGRADWQLRNEDLERFLQALDRLNEPPKGEALLDTLDGWLDVRIVCDGHGHCHAQCQLVNEAEGRDLLDFQLSLDPSILLVLKRQLQDVLDRFPVIRPDES